MTIHRDGYLRKLIDRKQNGLVKIVTGIRRCGKSVLLFDLFKAYLTLQRCAATKIRRHTSSDFSTKRTFGISSTGTT